MKDLSGDGKITQKDVLIGRGVINKKKGGMVGYMGGGTAQPTSLLCGYLASFVEPLSISVG